MNITRRSILSALASLVVLPLDTRSLNATLTDAGDKPRKPIGDCVVVVHTIKEVDGMWAMSLNIITGGDTGTLTLSNGQWTDAHGNVRRVLRSSNGGGIDSSAFDRLRARRPLWSAVNDRRWPEDAVTDSGRDVSYDDISRIIIDMVDHDLAYRK